MNYLQQLFQVMVDPEYTTITLYDSPRLRESFMVVSTYALFTSLDAFFSGFIQTETIGVGLLSFLISGLTTYLFWVFLALVFHATADMLGGLGEFPHALGFVGLGTAPLVFTSFISIILTLLSVLVFPDDDSRLLPNISVGLTLLGLAWGAPGVICYFGMKNAEKLHPLKAFAVSFVLTAALILLVLYKSDII
ncbi:MAG: YIP1 family protein [Ignavibacteriales bacterium]|nr:YIP1 family protein [Ignavibacteriales bacterium]